MRGEFTVVFLGFSLINKFDNWLKRRFLFSLSVLSVFSLLKSSFSKFVTFCVVDFSESSLMYSRAWSSMSFGLILKYLVSYSNITVSKFDALVVPCICEAN